MTPFHIAGMIYGYARVSTDGQTLDTQVEVLTSEGVDKVYRETASGANADRPELRKVISKLKSGDTLIVTRLDRLARSTRDLLNLLDEIGNAGATFRSLADTWADTTTPHGRLMITILGGLAEFERSLILARTSEGTRRAKERGVKFGPKEKLTGTQRRYVVDQKAAGTPVREIARIVGVSPATISRVKTD